MAATRDVFACVTEFVVAKPVVAKPVVAKPVVAKPVVAGLPGRADAFLD
jgi:hypothetical protein